jgi:AcrR family transcriptional regulator
MPKRARPRRRVLMEPEDRRQQLLDSATAVFARKGYRRASITDVVNEARTARGTFYLYFESKEQVFLAIVERFHAQVRLALADAEAPRVPAGGVPALLRESFTRWLRFVSANRAAATVILKEASSIDPRFEKGFADLRQSALAFFARRFAHLQKAGAVRKTPSADLMAHIQLGIFDELLSAFVLRDADVDLDALVAALVDFEWNGARPDPRG